MYIVTSEEMRKIDQAAIEQIGIPALVLMENAGRAVAEEAMAMGKEYPRHAAESWLILAGKGNNGADGVVAARHLAEAGYDVSILYAEDPTGFAGEAAVHRDIAVRLGLRSAVYSDENILWNRYDGIIDGLLGTGSRGAPRGVYAALIREANESGLPVIAIDIPSGLHADTGEVFDPCIRATRTVALAFAKRGMMQHPGASVSGKVVVRPIGIPVSLAQQFGVNTYTLDERTLREQLGVDPGRTRSDDTHKGSYGHVLLVAGSRSMTGAGLLSAHAALRGGCGLITWVVPNRLMEPLIGHCPEAMLFSMSDKGTGDWSQVDPSELAMLAEDKETVVIGPGLGRWTGDTLWLQELWSQIDGNVPLVIDADALNLIADANDFASWPRRRAITIMTPHPGEMARLAGRTIGEVQRDRITIARSYAVKHQVTLVLKGSRTVVAVPSGDVYINGNGNAGMATAGAGDVLAGLIGSLRAQGLSAGQAASLGVWLHGAAGDRAAARRKASASLIARDIIEEL